MEEALPLRLFSSVRRLIEILEIIQFSTDFDCLVIGSDDGTLGEGLVFDEMARPDVLRDVAFFRENYAMTSVVTKNGLENLVLIRKNLR